MTRKLPTADPFWDAAYEGTPPWDIGRPQPAFVELADAGAVHGAVLDAGCGTGDNALMLAARGHEVVGVDVAAAAVERARRKARERGLTATFQVADALDLDPGALGRTFDTVIDCGLFHTFTDEGRERYAASVARVLAPGGVLHLMCFSEETPGDWGPRRVRQREIRALFGGGFRVVSIRAARFDTNLDEEIHAWLATVVRASADA